MFSVDHPILEALGKTLIHSIWMGFVAMLFTMLCTKTIPKEQAGKRANIATLGLVGFAFCVLALLWVHIVELKPDNFTLIANTTTDTEPDSYLKPSYQFGVNPNYLAFLWFTGLLILLLRLIFGASYLWWINKTSSLTDNDVLLKNQRFLMEKMQIAQKVHIKISDKVSGVFTYGVLHPVIIWPIAMLNKLSEEEAAMILAHELAHIKRFDFIIKLCITMICTVFYYHPFIWWAERFIDEERECACDNLAIEAIDNQVIYAKTLLKIKEDETFHPYYRLINSFNQNNSFSNRIKRLFNMPINNSINKAKLTFLLICFTTIGLLAYHNLKRDEQKANNDDFYTNLFNQTAAIDSIKPLNRSSRSSQTITKIENGKSTTIKMEDGKITEVEVDGKKVDESEFDNYQKEHGIQWMEGGSRGRMPQIFKFDTDGDFTFEQMPNLDSLLSKARSGFRFGFGDGDFDNMFENGQMFNFDSIFNLQKGRMGDGFFGFNFEDGENIENEGQVKRERRGDTRSNDERKFDFLKRSENEKKDLEQVLGNQLNKDGFLAENKSNTVELNGKQLKVNGEKMPQVIFEKYKRIFEEETGLPLNSGTTIKFNMESKPAEKTRKYKAF